MTANTYKHKLTTQLGSQELATRLNNGGMAMITLLGGKVVNVFIVPVRNELNANIVSYDIGSVPNKEEYVKITKLIIKLGRKHDFLFDDLAFHYSPSGPSMVNVSYGKIDLDLFLQISDLVGEILNSKTKYLFVNSF